MRWFEHAEIADMVLSARADSRHSGYIALQPIVDLLELIARQLKRRGAAARRDEQRKTRSSFPPRG